MLRDRLRQTLLLDADDLQESLRRHRFDYLQIALDLPDLLPELGMRLQRGLDEQPPPSAGTPRPGRNNGRTAGLLAAVGMGFAAAVAVRRCGH